MRGDVCQYVSKECCCWGVQNCIPCINVFLRRSTILVETNHWHLRRVAFIPAKYKGAKIVVCFVYTSVLTTWSTSMCLLALIITSFPFDRTHRRPRFEASSLIDMEIPAQEVCVAVWPLRRPLPGLRRPLFGHLLCPWPLHNFDALFPNDATLHPFHCGKPFDPTQAIIRPFNVFPYMHD